MLLRASMFSKSSFFGSLVNKCRPSIISPSANISLSSTARAKTLEEKAGLPPRPKKPLTPFFRYMKEMRPKVMAENTNYSITDTVRAISKKWTTEDPNIKQRLQEQYKRDQQQYLEQRTKYDSKISEEKRAELKQLKQELAEVKERRLFRQRVRDLGRPKKPMSAFFLYMAKEREVTPIQPKQTFRDWHKKATEKWTRLSESDKAPFMKDARKELEVFKKQITAWEEQMVKAGNIDVVRHSALIDPPEPKPKKNVNK